MTFPANTIPTLPSREVHVYLVFPKEIQATPLLSEYHRMMNPEETEKQRRFYFERDRHQYLVTRATIRTLLQHYVPSVAAQDWMFEKNRHGRPEISRVHAGYHRLRFNLSHTHGLIACAVVWDREIGVDVETVDRNTDLLGIADRFFSPNEVNDLRCVPETDQHLRFFDYWTLKESYIKARGMGLAIPLDHFSFGIGDHPELSLDVNPAEGDPADRWVFKQWWVDPTFKLALALERPESPAYRVVLKKYVPLAGESAIQPQLLRSSFGD